MNSQNIKPTYILRFFFDYKAGGCLWSGNDAAYEKYGVGPLDATIYNLKGKISHEPKIKLPRVLKNRRSAWAQYTIMVDDRENFAKHLQSKGVPTSVHYPTPVHQQPAYKQWATEALPNAEKAAKSVISLPMYPDMTDAIQDQVVEAILSFYR